MSLLTRLYRGETEFDIVGQRKRWFAISAALIVISLLGLGVRQLNLSVDFEGGTVVTSENPAGASIEEVRAALGDIGQASARVQLTDEGAGLLVQTASLDGADQDELVGVVAEVAGVSFDETNVQAVGPTFGDEITRRAVEALLIFLLVVAVFISLRFEWKMAVAALAALFHDLTITAGVYAISGIEVTPATVIAVLTILGYSLYDTVVVFDKVTENVDEYGDRSTFSEIANLSMNQVLMRSINTSLTSLLPVGSLLFVGSFLLGAATLREFALALFVGIAAGTYSSIFVASPLLTELKEREPDWQRAQTRIARRGDPAEVTRAVPAAPTGAAPKPPKRRRR